MLGHNETYPCDNDQIVRDLVEKFLSSEIIADQNIEQRFPNLATHIAQVTAPNQRNTPLHRSPANNTRPPKRLKRLAKTLEQNNLDPESVENKLKVRGGAGGDQNAEWRRNDKIPFHIGGVIDDLRVEIWKLGEKRDPENKLSPEQRELREAIWGIGIRIATELTRSPKNAHIRVSKDIAHATESVRQELKSLIEWILDDQIEEVIHYPQGKRHKESYSMWYRIKNQPEAEEPKN